VGRRPLSLLLDTHTFLWLVTDSPLLSPEAAIAIEAETGEVFVSAVSIYELSYKHQQGKLAVAGKTLMQLGDTLAWHELSEMPVAISHAKRAGEFANLHRDPFDRLLAAQAIVENIQIVTIDTRLRDLGATVLW
jgi:PIN domain nuclease of toxin-antitoxin system